MVRFYFLLYFYLFCIASNLINSHRYRPPLVAEVISISFSLKNFSLTNLQIIIGSFMFWFVNFLLIFFELVLNLILIKPIKKLFSRFSHIYL